MVEEKFQPLEIAVAKDYEIVKVDISDVEIETLAEDKEMAAAYVSMALSTNQAYKDAKSRDDEVKDNVKRMCKEHMERGESVTIYDFENSTKLTLRPSKGGAVLDEDALLEQIYLHFGEKPGDRTGRAWEAYCAISDPVANPRKVNPDKLAEQIKIAQQIKLGERDGMPMVTEKMVESVTVVKKPVYSVSASEMTKGELSAVKRGELTDHLVIGSK